MDGSDLSQANLSAFLDDATFVSAILRGSQATGATLRNADFSYAYLFGSDFIHAQLSDALFKGANLGFADFFQADLSGADLSGAYVRGAKFFETLTSQQLISTASYQDRDLREIWLGSLKLDGINLERQNLRSAFLQRTTLRGADLRGADLTYSYAADVDFNGAILRDTIFTNTIIGGAKLSQTTQGGFTAQQLYSTEGYSVKILFAVDLWGNNLSGWDFHDQNMRFSNLSLSNVNGANFRGAGLQSVDFHRSSLHGADFANANLNKTILSGADLRGALNLTPAQLAAAITTNTILPDGTISGLDVSSDGIMLIRNHPQPIHILTKASFDPSATLQIALSPDWTSTIGFESGIPVTLAGDLELFFAEGFTRADLAGMTFKLFDWTGVTPTGEFKILDPASWDASRLYIDGTVTLIPEPSSLFLLSPLLLLLRHRAHRAHRA